jgi:hypothetical protein
MNKRTGKALRCPYEAIDLNLYEEGARMITFHTTLPRIQPCIKVLSIFYYDNLGKQNNIKLSWSDIPETWSDSPVRLFNFDDKHSRGYSSRMFSIEGDRIQLSESVCWSVC